MTTSKIIKDLSPGDRFYFPYRKNQLFTVIGFCKNRGGEIKSVKTMACGRLKPIYLGVNHSVELLVDNMKEYFIHLKTLHIRNELKTEFISPIAYDYLVDNGIISAEFYKKYIESACIYRQLWWEKRPLTLAESLDRNKVHDRNALIKSNERFANTIAKKMVVYDYVSSIQF